MKLSRPRFMYAVCFSYCWRFRYQDWLAFLKRIASDQDTDIEDYATKLGKLENIESILPKEAEELLNKEA